MLVAFFPLHQQRTTQSALLLRKTLHHPLPLRPRCRNPSADPVKLLFPLGACLNSQIDTQERVPPTGHNGPIEPPGIQSPIRRAPAPASRLAHCPLSVPTALPSTDARTLWHAPQSLITATGMAQPRTSRLLESTVQRSTSVLASRAKASRPSSPAQRCTIQRNKGPKQLLTRDAHGVGLPVCGAHPDTTRAAVGKRFLLSAPTPAPAEH